MGWELRAAAGRRSSDDHSDHEDTLEESSAVLVVAEDFATRQSLIAALTSAEIEAFGATAEEALDAQALHGPAVALIEHVATGPDGVGLARRFKERDPDIPVLLLTDPGSLESAQPSGSVDGYLVKPLASAAFIQTVRGAISQRWLLMTNKMLAGQLLHREASDTPEESGDLLAVRDDSDSTDTPTSATPQSPDEFERGFLETETSASAEDPGGSSKTERVLKLVPEEPAAREQAPAPTPAPQVEEPTLDFDDRLRSALTLEAAASRSAAVFLVQLGLPEGRGGERSDDAGEVTTRAAERIAATRRKTDKVVAAGSQRFVVVCNDVESASAADLIAAGIVTEMSRPFSFGADALQLGVSVGVVLTGTEAGEQQSPELLLEDAWLAQRMATEEGLRWKVLDDTVGEGVRLADRLRRAMDSGELGLVFQRMVDLQTSETVGAEALLRWNRRGRDPIVAADFMDKVRESGMAPMLGQWVLGRALAELVTWRADAALSSRFRLYVNVSSEEVSSTGFAGSTEKLLRDHGVAPNLLSLQISEDGLEEAACDPQSVESLRQLADLGVGCVVGHFGTGRSSLDWLQTLPVVGLKIAPELVAALDRADAKRGPALVRGLIALGHELQMTIVADGVQSATQSAALRAMGCDVAEGPYVSPPQSAQEIEGSLG